MTLYARADDSSPRGAVFVPFCYYEAAINKLTNAALDPFAKIPEFKYCAVRIVAGRRSAPRRSATAVARHSSFSRTDEAALAQSVVSRLTATFRHMLQRGQSNCITTIHCGIVAVEYSVTVFPFADQLWASSTEPIPLSRIYVIEPSERV